MKVNFIVTCFDKEDFCEELKSILLSFKVIEPIIWVSYNGIRDDFNFNSKIKNLGLQEGELSLIQEGYKNLKDNGVDLWVKLSADSWLCDEDVVINIFNALESQDKCYAGNYWNNKFQLSTDIFFCNTKNGNIFDYLKVSDKEKDLLSKKFIVLENIMYKACAETGKAPFIIWDREPVHPLNREKCSKLKWTMSHSLSENLSNKDNWANKYSQLSHFYESVCSTSAVKEYHLPILRKFSKLCKTILEIDTKSIFSSLAFLMEKPERLIVLGDVKNISEIPLESRNFQYYPKDQASSVDNLPLSDLIFIQLLSSDSSIVDYMKIYSKFSSKYIIFNSTNLFKKGESLKEFGEWKINTLIPFDNGILVLERK